MDNGSYQFCYPVLQCCAREHFLEENAVGGRIVVPFRALPIPRNNHAWTAPEVFKPDWEEWFACSECGAVRRYSARDIRWNIMEKPELGDYSTPGNFYSVHAPCRAESCEEMLNFIVDMKFATAEDLQIKLRRGFFFGMWPCGHRILPFSEEQIQMRRIAVLPSRKAPALAGAGAK